MLFILTSGSLTGDDLCGDLVQGRRSRPVPGVGCSDVQQHWEGGTAPGLEGHDLCGVAPQLNLTGVEVLEGSLALDLESDAKCFALQVE